MKIPRATELPTEEGWYLFKGSCEEHWSLTQLCRLITGELYEDKEKHLVDCTEIRQWSVKIEVD